MGDLDIVNEKIFNFHAYCNVAPPTYSQKVYHYQNYVVSVLSSLE